VRIFSTDAIQFLALLRIYGTRLTTILPRPGVDGIGIGQRRTGNQAQEDQSKNKKTEPWFR
jgi:hypothetical protein